MNKKNIKEQLLELMSSPSPKINTGEEFRDSGGVAGQPLEKIVSIPVYIDDDYTSIVFRFIEALGDIDVIEGFDSFLPEQPN